MSDAEAEGYSAYHREREHGYETGYSAGFAAAQKMAAEIASKSAHLNGLQPIEQLHHIPDYVKLADAASKVVAQSIAAAILALKPGEPQ